MYILYTFLGMIDSLGGSTRVNNLLATLNLKTINDKNLKGMERRAGPGILMYADKSMKAAADASFKAEME